MGKRPFVRASMLLCLLWGVIICWMSLTPSPPHLTAPVLGWDKAQHASAYAVLTFLALSASVSSGESLAAMFKVVLVVVLYGALMELAQWQLTSNRTADILDAVANTVGALSALALYRMMIPLRRSREERG